MKLRNKKTGEIGYPYFQNWKEISCVIVDENAKQIAEYSSLAELNKEWEDVPEEAIQVYIEGIQNVYMGGGRVYIDYASAQEAEKAVEKLKAWKRLNNCGLKFIDWWLSKDNHIIIGTNRQIFDIDESGLREDIDLLFGGEE